MDQIRSRSVGHAPVVGVDAEIGRLRGRDPLPPRVVSAAELADLLAGQQPDERLVLDVDQPAVRAVLVLFVQLKSVEGDDGSWNGGDAVAIVSGWLARLGIDPDLAVGQLDGRVISTAPAGTGRESTTWPATSRARPTMTRPISPSGTPWPIWTGSPSWSVPWVASV